MATGLINDICAYSEVAGDLANNETPIDPAANSETYTATKRYQQNVTATFNGSSGTALPANTFSSVQMVRIYNLSTSVTATLVCILGLTVSIDIAPGRSVRLPGSAFTSLGTFALRAPNGFTAECDVTIHGN